MTKVDLKRELLNYLTEDEWDALRKDHFSVPVSWYNRQILLRLHDEVVLNPDDEVDEDRMVDMEEALITYLTQYMPEEPGAHLPILLSCLTLSFIFGEPLHSQRTVKWMVGYPEDYAVYYCPARDESEGSLCRYCVCRSTAEWEERNQRYVLAMREADGEKHARIREALLDAGMTDTGIIRTQDLVFHQEVLDICQGNSCGYYNTTWTCPPAVGTLDQCRSRCLAYSHMQLFMKGYPMGVSFDANLYNKQMQYFKNAAMRAQKKIRVIDKNIRILSNQNCTLCETCAWPDGPCRFPQMAHHAIEGYGFIIRELAEKAHVRFYIGKHTLTFFGGVLYTA